MWKKIKLPAVPEAVSGTHPSPTLACASVGKGLSERVFYQLLKRSPTV